MKESGLEEEVSKGKAVRRIDASREFADDLEYVNQLLDPLRVKGWLSFYSKGKAVIYLHSVEEAHQGRQVRLQRDETARKLESTYAGVLDQLAQRYKEVDFITFDLRRAMKGDRKL